MRSVVEVGISLARGKVYTITAARLVMVFRLEKVEFKIIVAWKLGEASKTLVVDAMFVLLMINAIEDAGKYFAARTRPPCVMALFLANYWHCFYRF